MPFKESIERFETSYGVKLNSENIENVIGRIFTNNDNNLERDMKIRENVMSWYAQIAAEYERNKVNSSVLNTDTVVKKTPFEFFEEYINVVSEIAKETSEHMIAASKADAEKAKKAVEDAIEARNAAQINLEEKTVIAHEEAKKGTIKEESIQHIENTYKQRLENAEIALKNAQAKKDGIVSIEPYESSLDYFGLSEADANNMLKAHVIRYTYKEARRAQIESVGLTSPAYMAELNKAFENGASYQNASAEDKKRMQEVYATKQLVAEKLDSKKGFFGWLWKLINRSETKAMRNYLAASEQALKNAGFDQAAETEAMTAMAEKGYFQDEYEASGIENTVKERFSENEKAFALMREKEAERKALEKARKDEIKAETEAIQKKPFKNQLFEIRFRPSTDYDTFKAQAKEYNEVGKFIKDNKDRIPKDVLSVFKANSKKVGKVKSYFGTSSKISEDSLERLDSICEEFENKLISEISVDTYKPVTYEEVKASASVKEQMVVNLENPNAEIEVAKPVEATAKEKEPVVRE